MNCGRGRGMTPFVAQFRAAYFDSGLTMLEIAKRLREHSASVSVKLSAIWNL